METLYGIVGVWMIYNTVHFFIIQVKKNWKERSQYEKFLTISMYVFTGLLYLGLMFGE